MTQQFILIRGLPGSGKTTLAKKMKTQLGAKHYEADMYFEDRHGNYVYDASKIVSAHRWCQEQTKQALKEGHNVIVSNTFVQQWEMKVYEDMASEEGIELSVFICNGEYQNIHNVPEEVIDRMRQNWEE
ncbi:ATP-binding protein [Vibrio sp. HN007]|uniref:ATP-binding protein n=1 Tax=Vibrio iocasae TaxID=3098914 RepID=UPI0035D4B696